MSDNLDEFDKQMADIDKVMADMPVAPQVPANAPTKRVAPIGPPQGSRTEVVSIWVRLVLVSLLAVGLTVWPYQHACGVGLGAYLAALGVTIGTAGWTAASTWRLRLGLPHIISLGVGLAGLALLAHEVALRIGYALEGGTWFCP